MKKIQGSIWVKFLAWILISITGTSMILSLVVGIVCYEKDAYRTNSKETAIKEMLDNVSRDYAIKVMRDRDEGTNISYFEDTNFRYGLLETDDIEKVNLEHAKFIEKNFTEKVLPDDLLVYHMPTNKSMEYVFIDSLFGNSYIADYRNNMRWSNWYVDQICYDTGSGIFYYHAEEINKYYLIKQVDIEFLDHVYLYTYDTTDQKYHLESVDDIELDVSYEEDTIEGEENEQGTDADVTDILYGDVEYSDAEIDVIKDILTDEQGMDFTKLDVTKFNYENWENITFDKIRPYSNESEVLELVQVQKGYDSIADLEEEVYYLDRYYTLHTSDQVEVITKITNYYVVVLPPSQIKANIHGDLYERNMFLIEMIERYKYSTYVILFISAILTIALFIFLMCAAGYRKLPGTKEVVLKGTFLHKLPYEIEFIIWFTLGCCPVAYASEELSYVDDFALVLVSVILCGLIFAWIVIGGLTSLAARIKMGNCWKHTILYWVWMKCKTAMKKIIHISKELFSNRKILWKFWILFAGFKLVEGFIVLVWFGDGEGFGAFCILTFLEMITACVFVSFCMIQMQKLQEAGKRIANGDFTESVDTSKMYWDFKEHGEHLNNIGQGISKAVDEKMKSEHFKTELITNVSHDIKTPLTSIINYVDLLGKEELNNEKAEEYLEILNRQSSKLKKLIEDLVEASKASSGNLAVNMEKLDLCVFLTQTAGEWSEKLEKEQLELIITKPEEPVYIQADGRHLWRVVDNLLNNICKYAQQGSRVYIGIEKNTGVNLVFKNISKYQLNISAEELLERFVQGDKSRNTGGHGLGLSIAQSLMTLMKGNLKLVVDGDLFKVILSFNEA